MFSGKASTSRSEDDSCNLLMDLDDVRDLSCGYSKYRDFIRHLPLHLSKYILSMLGWMRGFLRDLQSWPSCGVSGSIFLFFPHSLQECLIKTLWTSVPLWASTGLQWLSRSRWTWTHTSSFRTRLPSCRYFQTGRGMSGDQLHFHVEVDLTMSLSIFLADPQLASCFTFAAF